MKILGLAGSLRQGSYNRALLRAAQELAPAHVALSSYDLAAVPLYNGDLEVGELPAPVAALKQAIVEADGLLIATPEYNYGVPGVLKNAIDWATRPSGASVLSGKPLAILGASPSTVGTARAQAQLKQVLLACQMLIMPTAEFLVPNADKKFDAQGRLVHPETREHLARLLVAFTGWVERVAS